MIKDWKKSSVLKMAKRAVNKNTYSKLKKVKDEEVTNLALYAIVSSFERDFFNLEKEIERIEGEGRYVLTVKSKLSLVPSKIKHFEATLSEEDFNKVVNLLNDIKKEIKNV